MRPRVSRAFAWPLLGALAACRPAAAPEAPMDPTPEAETLTPPDSPIAIRRSVVADEWFWLRAKVLEGEAPPAFREALVAMRDLKDQVGSDAGAWEDLELPLGTASRASELVTELAKLPEKVDVGGQPVALRQLAVRVAKALEATERAFRAGPYKEHDAAISAAAKELAARLVPNEDRIARALESDMSLPGLPRPIVVTLVGDAPYPTAFAADDRGLETASFVRVRGLTGGDLVESVLTESLHALDELTVKSPTAMNMLRASLVRSGLEESDANIEMVVNTVTFAEAASLVRRFVLPTHRSMAETGFYIAYPPGAQVAAAWDRHVAGEGIEATTEAIAAVVGRSPR